MLTVSNTNDHGAGSLRAAVLQANTDGGGDTIVFSSLFDTPQTITLTSGQLALTGKATTTISGPGASLLSVSGNHAGRVFGVYGGSAALSGLTITGGNADRGGGLRNISGTLSLTDATVSGNSASYRGGGLYTQGGGTTTLTDCTVSGNSAANQGGGLFTNNYHASGTSSTLTDCTVSGNSAPGGGGGVANRYSSQTTLTNCTVSGNSAGSGSGILRTTGSVVLTNTIVAGNTGSGDIGGTFSGSNNLIGGDPKLAPLGDYGGPTQTMALLLGSPAIDAGVAVAGVATDQRGTQRDDHPDIGAFEVAAATHFAVADFPSPTTAGETHNFTVTALDASNNTAPDYTGTVQFTSTDPQANLPSPYTFTSVSGGDIGRHTFAATLVTAGTQSITFEDGSIAGTQSGITVDPAPAARLVVSGFPSPVTAGTQAAVTVTAEDQFGNVDNSGTNAFNGTVTITSSDGQAILPSPTALNNGSGSFNVTLKTAGSQSITATGGGITGSQSSITVNPAAATQLVVSGFPSPVIAGTAGMVTVTAEDQFGNVDDSGPNVFNGTVTLTSSDGQAALPVPAALNNGSGSFNVTLKTAGSQSITATSGGLTGSQSGVTVNPAAANHFVVTASPTSATVGAEVCVTVTACDPYNNVATGYTGAVHLTSTDPKAILPADYTFAAADHGTHTFVVIFQTTGTPTVTATDTAHATITGTSAPITVTAGTAIQHGQSAGIGFWHGPNGQALIDSFNGGPSSTALANWLAASFPNLYGACAGSDNLTGQTNTQVAAFYRQLFGLSGPKLDAQVLATALNVYATTSSLGGTAGVAYGFVVTAAGLGGSVSNVGACGTAFGVPNNSALTVLTILEEANAQAVQGVLYNGNATLRNQALTVFDSINSAGGL
jgi:parallel beta-helix repeat protein